MEISSAGHRGSPGGAGGARGRRTSRATEETVKIARSSLRTLAPLTLPVREPRRFAPLLVGLGGLELRGREKGGKGLRSSASGSVKASGVLCKCFKRASVTPKRVGEQRRRQLHVQNLCAWCGRRTVERPTDRAASPLTFLPAACNEHLRWFFDLATIRSFSGLSRASHAAQHVRSTLSSSESRPGFRLESCRNRTIGRGQEERKGYQGGCRLACSWDASAVMRDAEVKWHRRRSARGGRDGARMSTHQYAQVHVAVELVLSPDALFLRL